MKNKKKKIIYTKLFHAVSHISPSLLTLLIIGAMVTLLCFGSVLLFDNQALQKLMRPASKQESSKLRSLIPLVKKIVPPMIEHHTASLSAILHIPILMYHYVEYVQDTKDTERQKLNVNPNVFEQQLQTLIAAHYTFITARDLGNLLDGSKPIPQNPIIITFDDGHWDLDTSVLPLLKKYNIHATAYIVPGFIGTNSDSLTPQEMQDIVTSGLIDVGAHTVHHLALKGRSLAQVQYEIDQSKQMLEHDYHIHVYSFAYPYGSFDKQAIDVVKQAGFTTAASTIAGSEQGNQNRFYLYRIRPGYLTGQALLNYVNLVWHSQITTGD